MNLNLGSGTNRKQDYISVDLYAPEADEHWDISKTWPYDDESVDNIYACHVIEHLDRDEFKNFVGEVKRCLKPGGSIEIRCPDIYKLCQAMVEDPYGNIVNHQRLYGLQNAPGEYHKSGHTAASLSRNFNSYWPELLPPSSDYELHMRFTK